MTATRIITKKTIANMTVIRTYKKDDRCKDNDKKDDCKKDGGKKHGKGKGPGKNMVKTWQERSL